MGTEPQTTAATPRGRHAPPLEVRLSSQRSRLFEAAAEVFCAAGYAEASAEAIAKAAGMSKATFYEHFANKEECLLALFDEAARLVLAELAAAAEDAVADEVDTYEEWVRRRMHAFIAQLQARPRLAQTLLVEVIGAGPRARERRDQVLDTFAATFVADNAKNAPRFEGAGTFATQADAYAVVGAIVEAAGRFVRTGGDLEAVETSLTRVFLGVLR